MSDNFCKIEALTKRVDELECFIKQNNVTYEKMLEYYKEQIKYWPEWQQPLTYADKVNLWNRAYIRMKNETPWPLPEDENTEEV